MMPNQTAFREKLRSAGVVFIAALAIRLLHLAASRNILSYELQLNDGMFFDALASAFISGVYDFPIPVVGLSPVYLAFLTGCYSVFGHMLIVPRLIQILLGAVSCACLQQIAAGLFGRRAGWIAGLSAAFCGIFIYFDMLLIKASLANAFLIFFLWAVNRDWKGKNLPLILCACAAYMMACMLRMQMIMTLPWLLIWGIREAWRRGARYWLFGFLCLASMFVTQFLFGVWFNAEMRHTKNVPLAEDVAAPQSGIHFYIGNSPVANGTYKRVPDIRASAVGHTVDARKIAETAERRRLTIKEVNQFWLGMTVKKIAADPWRWLKLEAKKFFLIWNAYEIPNSQHYDYWRRFSWVLKFPLVSYGWLAPFALLGWMGLRGDRRPMVIFLQGFAIFYILGLLATFVSADYRLPLHPVWILFSAYAIDRLWSGFEKRCPEMRQQMAWLFLFLIFCNYGTFLHRANFDAFMKSRHKILLETLKKDSAPVIP